MAILEDKHKRIAREVAEQYNGIDLAVLLRYLEQRARDTSRPFSPSYGPPYLAAHYICACLQRGANPAEDDPAYSPG